MIRTINVTKTSIRKGVREDPNSCAVARACRAARIGRNVSVSSYRVTFNRYGHTYRATLPKFVRRFIERFDNINGRKSELRPLSFVVRVSGK